MKLYLAIETSNCLMEGSFEDLLGVYSTKEKAIERLTRQSNFTKAKLIAEDVWDYLYDGTLTVQFSVEEIELDKDRYE